MHDELHPTSGLMATRGHHKSSDSCRIFCLKIHFAKFSTEQQQEIKVFSTKKLVSSQSSCMDVLQSLT